MTLSDEELESELDSSPRDVASTLGYDLTKKRRAFVTTGDGTLSRVADAHFYDVKGLLGAIATGKQQTGSSRIKDGLFAVLAYLDQHIEDITQEEQEFSYACRQAIFQCSRLGISVEGHTLGQQRNGWQRRK